MKSKTHRVFSLPSLSLRFLQYSSTNDMVIKLSTDNFEIEKDIHGFDHKISTDELYATHQRAGKQGIYVDDEQWAILKKNVAAILVENSEASSKGAGGV